MTLEGLGMPTRQSACAKTRRRISPMVQRRRLFHPPAATTAYMWSRGVDADAFAAFGEAGGPFDAETARKLETFILSAGGSQEADVLYTAFRGRMPGVEALLKGRGLDKVA